MGQDFEGMGPLVAQKAGDAPEHAEGFDGSCCDDFSTIEWLPTELAQNLRNLRLCRWVITAEEHSRCALFIVWIHHLRISHAVECLDDMRFRKDSLNFLCQRLI